MLTVNKYLKDMDEMEFELEHNDVMKECFEIIYDEIDFFFQNKEHLIDVYIEGINFSVLSPEYLQQRFYKVFYSKKDIENLLARIEKRVSRELMRASIEVNFNLKTNKIMDLFDMDESFLYIYESARTYRLSCTTEKAVNALWKRGSKSFIPTLLRKFNLGVKAGEYFLSTVGLTPKEIKYSIIKHVSNSIRGTLKNDKHELIKTLKKEVITPLDHLQSKNHTLILRRDITKSA